ncbi:hypothetical protein [aff. Roholtiella sp. LEGE 12411]
MGIGHWALGIGHWGLGIKYLVIFLCCFPQSQSPAMHFFGEVSQ